MVAYEPELPSKMKAIHYVSSVSMLQKWIWDPWSIIPIENICPAEYLSFTHVPIEILDQQVSKFRSKDVSFVKVLWRNNNVEEITSEFEEERRMEYPQLFTT